jgi:hypothetical protein
MHLSSSCCSLSDPLICFRFSSARQIIRQNSCTPQPSVFSGRASIRTNRCRGHCSFHQRFWNKIEAMGCDNLCPKHGWNCNRNEFVCNFWFWFNLPGISSNSGSFIICSELFNHLPSCWQLGRLQSCPGKHHRHHRPLRGSFACSEVHAVWLELKMLQVASSSDHLLLLFFRSVNPIVYCRIQPGVQSQSSQVLSNVAYFHCRIQRAAEFSTCCSAQLRVVLTNRLQ